MGFYLEKFPIKLKATAEKTQKKATKRNMHIQRQLAKGQCNEVYVINV